MNKLHEIKHDTTGALMYASKCYSLRDCVEAAVKDGANLAGANLIGVNLNGANLARANLAGAYIASALNGANLTGANLAGACLAGACLTGTQIIDGGEDRRGYRFAGWRHQDGRVIYRAGCHEWDELSQAIEYYGESYDSTGDRQECLARLKLIHTCAIQRGWVSDERGASDI